MTRDDLLLELLLEEMPAPEIPGFSAELKARVEALLGENRLDCLEVRGFATSRRAGVFVRGLALEQEAVEVEVTGPPVKVCFSDGKPAPALLGFLKREGLDESYTQKVYTIQTDKGDYAAVKKVLPSRPAAAILAEGLPPLLKDLHCRKPMKWGTDSGPYIRPAHALIVLLGGRVLPISFLGCAASRVTRGHRHLDNIEISVDSPGQYPEALRSQLVLIDPAERKTKILREARAHADGVGGTFPPEDPLLEEWAYLTEHPTVVLGKFNGKFLSLPEEILVQAIRSHQKSVPLQDRQGKLLPHFLNVIDKPGDPEGRMVHGIVWVVEARLADAAFFVDQDRQFKLSERVDRLQQLSYHPKLGNFLQKTGRIMELSEYLAYQLGEREHVAELLRAAKLMKADLSSSTVGEFPALQGKIGGLLAVGEGLSKQACDAIYDQYLPEAPEGPYPRNSMGVILNLADKMETIASLFAIEEFPTGSSDPYGLRRLGNGLMEILIEKGLELDLDLVATKAIQLLGGIVQADLEKTLEVLRQFFRERLEFVLERRGIPEDTSRAVIEVRACNPYDAFLRARAIEQYRPEKAFIDFILAIKRIRNITKDVPVGEIRHDLLTEAEEQSLFSDFLQAKGAFLSSFHEKNYGESLKVMETLAGPLQRFFENVLVMTENERIRNNRLALLQSIYREFLKVAQFSHLVVEKAQYR
jgi:glycyl-tRNA synthetase beta chain